MNSRLATYVIGRGGLNLTNYPNLVATGTVRRVDFPRGGKIEGLMLSVACYVPSDLTNPRLISRVQVLDEKRPTDLHPANALPWAYLDVIVEGNAHHANGSLQNFYLPDLGINIPPRSYAHVVISDWYATHPIALAWNLHVFWSEG